MKFYNRRIYSSEKGFSLIELMIVVAIIGILAAIAIPNYQRFVRKSKRADGIAQLNAYYTATMATYASDNMHYGNFVAVGYQPAGNLTYRVTTVDSGATPPNNGRTEAACVSTSVACTTAGFVTWTELASAVAPATAPTYAASATAFLTGASAQLGGPQGVDEISINQTKQLAFGNNGVD